MRQRRDDAGLQSLSRPRAPENPDTCHPSCENTPSSRPDTCHRFREPWALTDYTAGDVSETHRGARRPPRPQLRDPSGVDYACIKRFSLELPPWMTTLAWMAAPMAEDAEWRGFAGKSFRVAQRGASGS